MKKRSTEILQRLLKNPNEGLTVEKLTKEYMISEKTLRKDIQEILDFADEGEVKAALSFNNHSLRLARRGALRTLVHQMYSMTPYTYKMSLEERKVYIIVTLLQQDRYYPMQLLADELYVTRNTIINDCKVVEEYVTPYGISFLAKSKKGIRLEGTPEKMAPMLIDMFCALIPDLHHEKTFFVQFILRKMGYDSGLADIIYYMNEYVRSHNVIFAKDVFFETAICIFVLLNEMQIHVFPHEQEKGDDSGLALDVIGHIIEDTAHNAGCASITLVDIRAIESLIVRRGLMPKKESINDFELYGIICHFLLELSQEMGIDLLTDNLLIHSLLSHIKSMDTWKDSDFNFEQDYGESETFLQVRQLAESKFYILEQYLPYAMNEHMKDSIIVHICAALLRNQQCQMGFRVLISCPGSMATGKYLEAQVRNYFNFNIVDTLPAKKVQKHAEEYGNVDFVISTVTIAPCPLPVVVVSPLMTVDDIKRVQQQAFQIEKQKENGNGQTDTQPLLSRLRQLYETGTPDSIAFLNGELEKLLANAFLRQRLTQSSTLLRMLKCRYIFIEPEAMEWHDAMHRVSDDMIRDGFFDKIYVDEAIDNVEEYGNYIIVAQHIALAHARKEAGVHADGIGLLVCRDGIHFEDGDIVHLLFFFCQKGDTSYLDLFKEIIALGQDESHVRRLSRCPTAEAAYQEIADILVGSAT